jgi:hypothetical protein
MSRALRRRSAAIASSSSRWHWRWPPSSVPPPDATPPRAPRPRPPRGPRGARGEHEPDRARRLFFFNARGAAVTYYECAGGRAYRLGVRSMADAGHHARARGDPVALRSPEPILRRHRDAPPGDHPRRGRARRGQRPAQRLLLFPHGYQEVIRYQGRDVDVREPDGLHLNVSGTAIEGGEAAAAVGRG